MQKEQKYKIMGLGGASSK